MTDRRLFNHNERWMLYRMAGGKCQICGMELHGVFHADHIRPNSKGGETDVVNGQVLCGECNMRKSDHYSAIPDWTRELRDWQTKAFAKYLGHDRPDFLENATPGAGKTTFSLRIAHHELTGGHIKRVLIVVHTEYLRRQWAKAASVFGINFSTNYDTLFDLAQDYHGVITTYQTISARQDSDKSFRKYTSMMPTLGIFDEVHHIGEGYSWAIGLKEAGEPCVKRLSVTGTAFRSDRNPIPFVKYVDGVCVPDHSYGYGEALRDGVVRPVFFQTFDGDVSWFTPEGEFVEAGLSEPLSQRLAAQRLRHAVDYRGDWLHNALNDAHAKLISIREEDPSAAGLVVTKDQWHAEKVGEILEKITHERPVVVTYDTEGASDEIERFRKSKDKWIVAVKMISEGVDIERIRGVVWATNVSTELFFRQVAGRALRVTAAPSDQDAFMFIPKVEPLIGYAEQMKKERAHAIDNLDALWDEIEEERKKRERKDEEHIEATFAAFVSSSGEKSDLIHDDRFALQELNAARGYLQAIGCECTDSNAVLAARLLRHIKPAQTDSRPPKQDSNNEPIKTLEQRKKDLKNVLKRMIRPIREASNGSLDYPDIHHALNWAQNVLTIDECTFEQLKERHEVLKAWTEAWANGTGREFTVKGYLRERLGYVNS